MNSKKARTLITAERSRKMKKLIFSVTVFSVLMVCGATSASAAMVMMDFTSAAQTALKSVVTLLGGALGAWGVVNLLEAYGGDNPAGKSQGVKQCVAGAGLIIVGTALIPAIFST